MTDRTAFRTALGRFVTGVTVVTAVAETGEPVGLTANSFNSVSLDPPLVLWSLSRRSASLPVFERASHFAVNVLSVEQKALSDRFARRDVDRFRGVSWHPGAGGAPVLAGCAAVFECRCEQRFEGGDHVIFLGHVERFDHEERTPLAFHAGAYARPEGYGETGAEGVLSNHDLLHLLARAATLAGASFHEELEQTGISAPVWRVLALLADAPDGLTVGEIAARAVLKQPTASRIIDRMEADGHVVRAREGDDRRRVAVRPTPAGHALARRLSERMRAHEAALRTIQTPSEAAILKRGLDVLIGRLSALRDSGGVR